MALASSGATESCRIFEHEAAAPASGIELLTTNSSSGDEQIRSTAGPDKTACVAQAVTLFAP